MSYLIERVAPRTAAGERPARDASGAFILGSPAHGTRKHHAEHQVKVPTVEEAVALVRKGYSLRMGASGLRPSLVSPSGLRIVRHD